jgi:hypothetical protein
MFLNTDILVEIMILKKQTFSNRNPLGCSIKLIFVLVLPQFDGPTIRQRIVEGKSPPCLFLLIVLKSLFETCSVIGCCTIRILHETNEKNFCKL